MLSLSQKAALEWLCYVTQHDKLSSRVAAFQPGAHSLCKTPKPLAEMPGLEAEDFTPEPSLFSAPESRGRSPRATYFHSRRNAFPHSAFCAGESWARYLLSVDWMREVRSKQRLLGSRRQTGSREGGEKLSRGC